jgi:hypothetical protein
LQLEGLAKPKPKPATGTGSEGTSSQPRGGTGDTPTPAPAEPKLVPARTIKVGYAKPWLASESELDEYLKQQREAWLKEIQAGNRVQI